MRGKLSVLTTFGAFVLALAVSAPAHAQLGGLKKLGGKIKDGAAAGVDKVKGGKTDKTTDEASGGQDAKAKNLKDGETAVIHSELSEADATAKVKSFFNSKDIEYTVNQDTGRISTDWYGERRCGPGFNRCANKATVRLVTEEGKTTIRVQVLERKREAGINNKPWNENSTSKGKETSQLAADLEAFLGGAKTAK